MDYKDMNAIGIVRLMLTDGVITEEQATKYFPELKESEDKESKKWILEYLYNGLRKSDEQFKGQFKAAIAWLEKQGEQKPTDKIKPKFHEGEWITDGYVGGQITSIEDNYPCYKIADFMGGINTSIPFTLQDNYHLWTIDDAKEGDVLSYVTDEEDLWIMIYWSLYEPYEGHVHYHALLVNDNFSDKGTCCICINDLKPATKEQCNLLFEKMKEAGYEWDSKNKELQKIEHKPTNNQFTPEQADVLDKHIDKFLEQKQGDSIQINPLEYINDMGGNGCYLKNAIQASAWSEEDEKMLSDINDCVKNLPIFYESLNINGEDKTTEQFVCDAIKWLKSLKERYT